MRNILHYSDCPTLVMNFSKKHFHTGRKRREIAHSMRLDLLFPPALRKNTARVPFGYEKCEKLYFSAEKSYLEASCEKSTMTIEFYGQKNLGYLFFRTHRALLECEKAFRRKQGSKWLDTHTEAERGNRMGVPLNKSHLLRSSTHF